MIKRIIKSIINQPFKTTLFLIVMIILSLNLCTSFIMQKASNNVREQVFNSVKPKIVIRAKGDMLADMTPNYLDNRGAFKTFDEYHDYVKAFYQNVKQLVEDNNIDYFDFNATFYYPYTIAPYDENRGVLVYCDEYELQSLSNANNNISQGFESSYNLLMDYINKESDYYFDSFPLTSVATADFSSLHFEENYIVKGRTFTDEEIAEGENVVVLVGEYSNGKPAYYKDEKLEIVELGDTIKFSLFYPTSDGKREVYKTYDFKLIGMTNKYRPLGTGFSPGAYIPEKCFEEIANDVHSVIRQYNDYLTLESEKGEYRRSFLSNFPVMLELRSLEDVDSVIEDIENMNFEQGYNRFKSYTYETSVDDFMVLSGDIESVSHGFNSMFIFSLFASVILLVIIFALELNARKSELAILMSLGETKRNIILQLIIEYSLILLLAFVIALFMSQGLATYLSKNMIDMNTFLEANYESNSAHIFDRNLKRSDIIAYYDIYLSFKDILVLLALQLLTAISAITLVVVYILRIEPKEVLIDER